MTTFMKAITKSVKHWYIPLIIGILSIALGIYVFTVPVETYLTLSVLFSISFIVIGLLDIFFSIRNRKILEGWGWYLVGGLLTLAAGIILIIYPEISVTVLPFVVGFTLLFLSFLLMGFSFEMKNLGVMNWGYSLVLSVFGVVFSFMLIVSPAASGMSLVTLTGIALIFIGAASIALSIDLRKVKKMPEKMSTELKAKIEALQKEVDEANAAK